MSTWVLPAPAPYQGAARCPACAGAKLTGDRYRFDPGGTGGKVLLADVICPRCGGCGRATHDGCKPNEHADWPHCDEYDGDLDEHDDDDEVDGCPSCHGRRWWACQGFTSSEVHHLRVACGCATDLLVEVPGATPA